MATIRFHPVLPVALERLIALCDVRHDEVRYAVHGVEADPDDQYALLQLSLALERVGQRGLASEVWEYAKPREAAWPSK